jgi:hypothetical protein
MPGPAPKDASTRARRNKVSTSAKLIADPDLKVPPLPKRDGWHEMTVQWWNDLWSSPMAPEFDTSDMHGLYLLALLMDDFWLAGDITTRIKLAAELRQQGQRFGLSPIDRRRLQWEIERTEEAQQKGAKRRASTTDPAEKPAGGSDPRSVLRAV